MKQKTLYHPPVAESFHVDVERSFCESQQFSNTIYIVDMKEADYSDLWED